MKLIRKEKIKQTNGLCESCGKKGNEIHHKDKTKTNHSPENFLFLCRKCHMGIYHKDMRTKPCKFSSLSTNEIGKLAGCSGSCVYLHLSGKIKAKKHGTIIDKIVAANPKEPTNDQAKSI